MYPDGPSTLQQLGRATVRAVIPQPALQAVRGWRSRDEAGQNIATSLISRGFAERIDLGERLATLRAHRPQVPPKDAGAESVVALQHPYVTVALERYHRVAAAHGVQPRHPFTDRQLIEFAVTLPDRQRQSDGWSKAVLRRGDAWPVAGGGPRAPGQDQSGLAIQLTPPCPVAAGIGSASVCRRTAEP